MNQLTIGSERRALERILHILDTPEFAQVVPQLRPELLHRVIQSGGLEECVELLSLVTPAQLTDLFDLDLWRAARPGGNEQFDSDRFGLWIEVLAEAGPSIAAQKLAGIDPALVSAGLAQLVLVFDRAAVADFETLSADVGGFGVAPRRTDAWDAIVSVLTALNKEHRACFQAVMTGCRALSNPNPEIDGLDNLLPHGEQVMLDVAIDRQRRQEQQGYVTPADARAFLAMSRKTDDGPGDPMTANPIARAYFQALGDGRAEEPEAAPAQFLAASTAGISGVPALTSRLARIHAEMAALHDGDPAAFARRIDELLFLANTLKAGCVIQERAFTSQEAWDAAVAVCNLGLESLQPAGNVLADRDLIGVFQIGWTTLHDDVATHVAAALVDVLKQTHCSDRAIQAGLNRLRVHMGKELRAGAPWRARDAMDVLASLDLPSWAMLLGLIDECPVLVTEGATAFEFISEKSQVQSIQAFAQSLAEKLAE